MKFCGNCGQPLAASDDASAPVAVGTEHVEVRQMTVLFCDLVGSTPLAERLDAEDLLEVIIEYRQACARAIDRFEGHIARHVGDGMIVYFGYPLAVEDDAVRAAHTGLAIIDELAILNRDIERRFDVRLQVRIGAHTGTVVAGSIGGKGGDDILGETPNIAARIESGAAADTVVVSGVTANFLERYFELEPQGEADLAGVSRNISTFRVVRPTGIVGRIDVIGPHEMAPMRGRDTELDRLTALWQHSRTGDGQVALISAQPGMGKSRMVHALIEAVGSEATSVQVWQCSPHHQTRALHPVIAYLEAALGIERSDTAASIEVIETALDAAGLLDDDACLALATLFDLDSPNVDVVAAARETRATTLRVLEALLIANAAHHPLLLVIDDAQWADPTTLELLGRVVKSVPASPVMVLFAARPEFELPWAIEAPLTHLRLQPLAADDVAAMLSTLPSVTISASIQERVITAADGVPLFVEEIAKMLVAESNAGSDLEVPVSLRGLLMARLDHHADARDLVSLAAVLGREFSGELLAAIAPGLPAIDESLKRLAADGLLHEEAAGAVPHFTFSHSLIREIAYGALLRKQRRELHRTVASAVAERLPLLAEVEPEMVAFHWSRGDAPAQAVPFWHAAGERALRSASFQEAADHYRRGLDDIRTANGGTTANGDSTASSDTTTSHALPLEADFLTSLGASLQAGWGYATDAVDDVYVEARHAALHTDRYPIDAIDRGEFMMELLRARYSNALEVADAVLTRGQGSGHEQVLVEGHLYSGLAHMYLGHLEQAQLHLQGAIDQYSPTDRQDEAHDALGDSGVMAMAYLAPVLWILGQADEATELRDLSLTLADGVARPMTFAQTWGMHALGQVDRGDRNAVESAARAFRFADERDIPYWRSLSGALWGWMRGRSGQLQTGLDAVLAHREAYIESGSRLGLPLFHIFSADLRELEEDYAGGLDDIDQALEHIEATGEKYFYSGVLRTKARLLLSGATPDVDAAKEALQYAVNFDQSSQACTREFASLLQAIPLALGQERSALLERLKDLYDGFGPSSEVPGIRQARALLA